MSGTNIDYVVLRWLIGVKMERWAYEMVDMKGGDYKMLIYIYE